MEGEGAENSTTTQTTTEAAPPAAAATATSAVQTQTTPAATTAEPHAQIPAKKPSPADFFKQREEKREKKAHEKLAELQEKYDELEKKVNAAPQPTQAEPDDDFDWLSDPKKARARVVEDARRAAIEAFEQREREAQFDYNANRATDWLLTRSTIKDDPKLVEEVGAKIREKYPHIGKDDPNAAIRLAYLDVCAAKGVLPDMDGFKQAPASMTATGGTATSGARPSAAAGGKRVFGAGEVTAYMNGVKPDSPEYRRRLLEVEEAYKEGRVKT